MDDRAMMIPDPRLCPDGVRESLERYIQHGVLPGSFLRAVLRNDLTESVGYADAYNCAALPHIAMWLYNEAPAMCWGSQVKVDAWIAMFSERYCDATQANKLQAGGGA